MGDDFTNHQAFTEENLKQRPVQLLSHVQTYMAERGYVEVAEREAADRSIALGPPGCWICIYDSAGNGDDANLKEFEDLALHLSRVVPVVDIHMSDSAALQMLLYRNRYSV